MAGLNPGTPGLGHRTQVVVEGFEALDLALDEKSLGFFRRLIRGSQVRL